MDNALREAMDGRPFGPPLRCGRNAGHTITRQCSLRGGTLLVVGRSRFVYLFQPIWLLQMGSFGSGLQACGPYDAFFHPFSKNSTGTRLVSHTPLTER